MKKLIILTTAIIRGDYHIKSIGKFYSDYSEIINYKGSDFVVYTCSNRKYGFAIGTSGNGIVRYFPDGVTDE